MQSINMKSTMITSFINTYFNVTEMLSNSRGRYTSEHINRCSRMGGSFGKEVKRLFRECIGQEALRDPSKKKPQRYSDDLKEFIREYEKDGLFEYLPPRQHESFPSFVDSSRIIKSPVKFGQHLAALSKEMDFWRHRAQRAREPFLQDGDGNQRNN